MAVKLPNELLLVHETWRHEYMPNLLFLLPPGLLASPSK